MKENGFMPMATAGILMLFLTIAVVGQTFASGHAQSLAMISDVYASETRKLYGEITANVRDALKVSVYRGLWEVSKTADWLPHVLAGKFIVEGLASSHFAERLNEISEKYSLQDPRVDLHIENGLRVEIRRAENGYVWATAELPQSYVKLTSTGGRLCLKIPLENVETFIDSRYFLLQERMSDFLQKRGDIGTIWKGVEYAWAWGEAWLSGKVELNEGRTKGFFQLAWATHELNSFGSSDYLAAALSLANVELPTEGGDEVIATPIRATDIGRMKEFIDDAIGAVEGAESLLERAVVDLSLAESTAASENLENEELDKVRVALENCHDRTVGARAKVSEAESHFNYLLNFLSQGASSDAVMAYIYQGLTTRNLSPDCPSLEEQIEWAVNGVTSKISSIENNTTKTIQELDFSNAKTAVEQLSADVKCEIDLLLRSPEPKRMIYIKTYKEDPPSEALDEIPVYIDSRDDGGIGGLKVVLQGAKEGLDKMNEFSQKVEQAPPTFEVDEGLKKMLNKSPPSCLNRENLYGILPPPPIRQSPGLSVYHDFSVKSVKYKREDIAGWFNSPTATPIPIPFIGVTLWWGQWDTEIKLESRAVEEIFDFDNPTIPLKKEFGYVHSPLAYKVKVPDETFGARVIVVSLKPFTISTS
ncbi:MAG: hypothetical protein AB1476_05210 [Candidatus Hadarchaeota archaeon]